MTLNDRATDRKAYSHAASLGRVECVEEPVGVTGVEPDPSIAHAQVYISSVGARGDHQLSRMIRDGAHGIACIEQQVEDHLLQLDAVASHWSQIVGKLESHGDVLLMELAHGKRDDLARRFVQIDRSSR